MLLLQLLFLASLPRSLFALSASECSGYLDSRGRNVVSCSQGGISGPLDLFNMSLQTEVLKISAPEDNANQLTMSPFLHAYKNLEEIHITRSNIPQLGKHFFWGLKKLDVLNLSQNNITQPLDHNFIGLLHLKELYLDDNRINSLPSGTFRHLPELKVLSIQRNVLTELTPRIFLEIGKLKVLKLSGNYLQELNPVVFEDVKQLKSLDCRFCGLTTIEPKVFQLLHHLTHLDIGDNKLTLIEFPFLAQLRHLKLDGNSLGAIKDSMFSNQHELKRLNLARNPLTKISHNAFANLHNLTELDLSHNNFDVRQGLLGPVASTLEVLFFNGNHLDGDRIKALLPELELRELHLVGCDIFQIQAKVFPNTIEVLDLADNFISGIEEDVLPFNLKELDLSGNRFMGLTNDFLGRLDYLGDLKLEKNPWSCDLCHIVPLLERANRSVEIRNLVCTQPYTHKGKKLGNLRVSELTWCTIPSSTSGDANFFLLGDDGRIGLIAASTSVCLLFFTIVGILALFLYSRRHAAKYYTHEDKLAIDGDTLFDNHSPLFGDDRELNFKFERKLSVSTIEEIKKEHSITKGT